MSNATWKSVLDNPFGDRVCGIPDDRTLLSGKFKSRTQQTYVPTQNAGASSNTHSGGIMIRPYPWVHYGQLFETGSQTYVYTDLTAGGGAVAGTATAANATSFYPTSATGTGSCLVRMVACGVKVTYLGTELNRSGRFYSGLLPISNPAQTNTTASALSPLSTLISVNSQAQIDSPTLREAMQAVSEERVSDGETLVLWKPSGVPPYQRFAPIPALLPSALTGGGTLYESIYACNPGGGGNAYGDMVLVILIENDYVSSPAQTGNQYTVTVDAVWEVVPQQQFGVIYPLTPSPFNPSQLATALNTIDTTTVGFQVVAKGRKRRGRNSVVATQRVQTPGNTPPSVQWVTRKAPGNTWSSKAAQFSGEVAKALAPAAKRAAASYIASALTSVASRRSLQGPSRRRIEL